MTALPKDVTRDEMRQADMKALLERNDFELDVVTDDDGTTRKVPNPKSEDARELCKRFLEMYGPETFNKYEVK